MPWSDSLEASAHQDTKRHGHPLLINTAIMDPDFPSVYSNMYGHDWPAIAYPGFNPAQFQPNRVQLCHPARDHHSVITSTPPPFILWHICLCNVYPQLLPYTRPS